MAPYIHAGIMHLIMFMRSHHLMCIHLATRPQETEVDPQRCAAAGADDSEAAIMFGQRILVLDIMVRPAG